MKYDRLQEIQKHLRTVTSASNEELMQHFDVSMQTLRRDIKELEEKKFLKKIYGGVVLVEADTWQNSILNVDTRTAADRDKKQLIGKLASSFVDDDDVIFIDSGTTAFHILPFLANVKNVTVISHSLHVMCALSEMPNIKGICLGGCFSRDTWTFHMDSSTYQYNYNKAFLSTVGISINKGLTSTDFQEGMMKHHVIENANEVYLLCDESKFGKVAFNHFADIVDIQVVITDQKPEHNFVDYFEKNNIKLLFKES